jgi:hypothetical protein
MAENIYRKVKFNVQYSRGHGRFQAESWLDGWFHNWIESSDRIEAVVEDTTGKIWMVEYPGLRFVEKPE